MYCERYVEDDRDYIFKGEYRSVIGPNWGWRTEIRPVSDELFELLMCNVSPSGDNYPAFKA